MYYNNFHWLHHNKYTGYIKINPLVASYSVYYTIYTRCITLYTGCITLYILGVLHYIYWVYYNKYTFSERSMYFSISFKSPIYMQPNNMQLKFIPLFDHVSNKFKLSALTQTRIKIWLNSGCNPKKGEGKMEIRKHSQEPFNLYL